jgi:hypothetical protein
MHLAGPSVDQDETMDAVVTEIDAPRAFFSGARPTQQETTPTGPTLEGVHLIHTIPSGIACVYDQAVRKAPKDQRFEVLLFKEYKNAEVAQQLAEQNDLVPNSDGVMSVFVPPGDPVVIPEMCYPKSAANAVALQPTGVPDPSGNGAIGGLLLIAFGFGALVLAWKWVSAQIVKVR